MGIIAQRLAGTLALPKGAEAFAPEIFFAMRGD
jgi:hypothetical protein